MTRPSLTWTSTLSQLLLWLFLGFALLAGVLGGIGLHERGDCALLAKDGIEAVGSVVGRDVSTRRRTNGVTLRTYYLQIQFVDAQGVTRQARQGVTEDEYDSVPYGQSVPLLYARSSPEIVEFEGGSSLRNGTILAALGAAFAVLSVLSLVAFLRRLSAMRRAARDGEMRLVPVLAHHLRGKARGQHFAIEWQDADGTLRRTKAVKRSNLPPLGSMIPVYYDPQSGRGWWQGDF